MEKEEKRAILPTFFLGLGIISIFLFYIPQKDLIFLGFGIVFCFIGVLFFPYYAWKDKVKK